MMLAQPIQTCSIGLSSGEEAGSLMILRLSIPCAISFVCHPAAAPARAIHYHYRMTPQLSFC
jgi:hypothetical protein